MAQVCVIKYAQSKAIVSSFKNNRGSPEKVLGEVKKFYRAKIMR